MIDVKKFENKEVIFTQVKSSSKFTQRQKSSLTGLGLGKIGNKSTLIATPDVLGMFKKVQHVVFLSILE